MMSISAVETVTMTDERIIPFPRHGTKVTFGNRA